MTTKVDSLRGLTGVESARKIGNNTWEVTYGDGTRAIRLHKTNVVVFRPDGKFVITSGGYLTRTTKDRINKYCRTIGVWQEKGRWYVAQLYSDGVTGFPRHYHEYMTFYPDGAYDGTANELA